MTNSWAAPIGTRVPTCARVLNGSCMLFAPERTWALLPVGPPGPVRPWAHLGPRTTWALDPFAPCALGPWTHLRQAHMGLGRTWSQDPMLGILCLLKVWKFKFSKFQTYQTSNFTFKYSSLLPRQHSNFILQASNISVIERSLFECKRAHLAPGLPWNLDSSGSCAHLGLGRTGALGHLRRQDLCLHFGQQH